ACLAFAQPFCMFHATLLSIAYIWLNHLFRAPGSLGKVSKTAVRGLGLLYLGFAIASISMFEGVALMAQSPRVGGAASLSAALLQHYNHGLVDLAQWYTAALRFFGHDLLGNGSAFTGIG